MSGVPLTQGTLPCLAPSLLTNRPNHHPARVGTHTAPTQVHDEPPVTGTFCGGSQGPGLRVCGRGGEGGFEGNDLQTQYMFVHHVVPAVK